jgi:hypothetical protein
MKIIMQKLARNQEGSRLKVPHWKWGGRRGVWFHEKVGHLMANIVYRIKCIYTINTKSQSIFNNAESCFCVIASKIASY